MHKLEFKRAVIDRLKNFPGHFHENVPVLYSSLHICPCQSKLPEQSLIVIPMRVFLATECEGIPVEEGWICIPTTGYMATGNRQQAVRGKNKKAYQGKRTKGPQANEKSTSPWE
jgi:hypothetical protein